MNNRSEVIVITGCDVDPINPKGEKISEGEEIWEGVTKGIPELKEMFSSFENTENPYPKITWLLRSDEQMNRLYDDYAYPANFFGDMWKSFIQDGDEIGWHPHMWNWDEVNKLWYPYLKDNKWISDCLENGYNTIKKYFKPTSVRTGWHFQSNFFMKKLNDLGIIVDFSALPEQKDTDFNKKKSLFCLDWEITSEKFYFPSKSDYRRGAMLDEESLEILEMPLSLTQISLFRTISKFWYRNTKHFINKGLARPFIPYKFSLKEPMRVTKLPKFFKPGVECKFKESKTKNCITYIISYFHPYELNRKGLFSISNFEKNLNVISEISKKYDVPFKFLTATEAADDYIKRTSLK